MDDSGRKVKVSDIITGPLSGVSEPYYMAETSDAPYLAWNRKPDITSKTRDYFVQLKWNFGGQMVLDPARLLDTSMVFCMNTHMCWGWLFFLNTLIRFFTIVFFHSQDVHLVGLKLANIASY